MRFFLADRTDPQSEKIPCAIPGDNRHVGAPSQAARTGSTSLTGRVCEAFPNWLETDLAVEPENVCPSG
jgi:hypothetical protein